MLELFKPGAPLRQFFAILPGEYNLALSYSIFTDTERACLVIFLSFWPCFELQSICVQVDTINANILSDKKIDTG